MDKKKENNKEVQYYMSPDGTVMEDKDYKWLDKHVNKNKKKKVDLGYEKVFKVLDE